MNKEERKLIKEINEGKNLEIALPTYAGKLSSLYHQGSLLQLSMMYLSLCEDLSADGHYTNNTLVQGLEDIMSDLFENGCSGEKRENMLLQLEQIRNNNIDKMDCLTIFTDLFQSYEYVLNRKELTFKEEYETIDEEEFVRKVIDYIFKSKEDQSIRENVKFVLGQLPVRMARSYFFRLVKDSFTIYKGSKKSAVDTYLYMLDTGLLKYDPKICGREYARLNEIAMILQQADFEHLTKKEYDSLCELLKEAVEFIQSEVNIHFALQQVLNRVYVYLLSLPYGLDIDETVETACQKLITTIMNRMSQQKNVVIDEEMEEYLIQLEGVQEPIADNTLHYESVLDIIREQYQDMIASMMLQQQFESFHIAEKLMAFSSFVRLDETLNDETVNENYIDQIADDFIEKVTGIFKENQMSVNRAIMADILSKLPMFFQSAEEIIEYIQNSLLQCKNEEEKTTAMELILNQIREEENWNL